MRFIKKQESWNPPRWHGRKKGFKFQIAYANQDRSSFYVIAKHSGKDIVFNSLWEGIAFSSLEEAQEFCESFDYTKHQVLGEDVNPS